MRFFRFGKLSKTQLTAISEIARDNAQVIFAGMVVAQLFLEAEKINWYYFISGSISSILLWILSVIILKR